MTITERIKLAIKWLIGNKVAKNQKEIGLLLGYKNESSFYQVLNDKVPLPNDFIDRLCNLSLKLNQAWLLTGEGSMLRDPENSTPLLKEPATSYSTKPNESGVEPRMVPHIIDEYADCGRPNGFGIAIMENRCPKYAIPGLSGHDFTIISRGRSMINRSCPEKSIRPGDIVGCKKWNSRNYIRWGEVYALSTPDGITIKQVQPSEKEGYIKCIPFNTEEQFQSFDIPIDEIYDWAIVVGVVSVILWA